MFCESLLSGEYILEKNKDLNKQFNILKKFINQNFDEIGETPDIQVILNENIKQKLVYFIQCLIDYYKLFTANLSLLTTNPFHEVSFSINNSEIPNKDLSTDIKAKIDLFLLYIQIQHTDHFFSDSEWVFKNLSVFQKKLKQSTVPSKLKTSVIEKINFLKHKWILRQYYYSRDDESLNYKGYIIDGEIREYFGEEEFVTKNDKLKEWSNYLDNHYGFGKHPDINLIKSADHLKITPLKNLSFLEIHTLIKYYKDVKKEESELRKICNYLIKKFNKIKDFEESQVYKKAIIYALNNYFSLLIEIKSETMISETREEIESFQNKFNLTNFFADKKLLKHELDKIQKLYDDRKILDDLKFATDELEVLSTLLERCRKRLEWAFKHHNLIFQLPYNDSLVPIQDREFPGIYYSSSFLLPIPEHTNKIEFKEIEIQFEKLRLLTNSISSLKPEFIEVQRLQESLISTQKDLKDNDFKSLEIIGIFTAIIAFIMTSVPTFKFVKSFKQAALFFGVLGASISLMVLIIFLVRKGTNEIAKKWIPITCLILIILMTIISNFS